MPPQAAERWPLLPSRAIRFTQAPQATWRKADGAVESAYGFEFSSHSPPDCATLKGSLWGEAAVFGLGKREIFPNC